MASRKSLAIGPAYKPRSVQPDGSARTRLAVPTSVGNHPSGPARRRGALAAYPELGRDEQPLAHERASFLLGLAPGGGCLAAGIAVGAGGLLHHLFTLTPLSAER